VPLREFKFQFGSVDGDAEHEADCIEALCEGFVRCNEVQILADPDYFPDDPSAFRYIPPPSCRSSKGIQGCQPVKGALALMKSGLGSCIDLACMYCALLRTKHGDRSAFVKVDPQIPNRQGLYHAVAVGGAGNIYDPELMNGGR
jgi:hypothetical protein